MGSFFNNGFKGIFILEGVGRWGAGAEGGWRGVCFVLRGRDIDFIFFLYKGGEGLLEFFFWRVCGILREYGAKTNFHIGKKKLWGKC